ncbi:peptidase [Nocardia wallacei]|uniref:Peptidase n=1 Tax=Nocardia wallacei TaxID=480035 RepID=A0A7G1KCD2_9NOCA|nr:peptidase [Nocardia wallacei]
MPPAHRPVPPPYGPPPGYPPPRYAPPPGYGPPGYPPPGYPPPGYGAPPPISGYRPPLPPPPPYGPPGRPPQRKRGGGWGVFLIVLILIVTSGLVRAAIRTGVHVAHSGDQPSYTYAPTTGKNASGTTGIAATDANPLLAEPGSPLSPARCGYAPWSTQVDAARKFFESAAGCLEQAWRPVLSAANLSFTPPKLSVTATTAGISTPCTGSSSNFAAFYCGANQTIYMPISQLQTAMFKDHWEIYLSVFAHEYGHHVQAQSGILSEANKQRRAAGTSSARGLELSRRVELQANCFDGMFLAATAGGGSLTSTQTGNTREDAYGRGDAAGDMRDHGSAQHMGDWWTTGFEQNRTSQCNTFKAPASQVS